MPKHRGPAWWLLYALVPLLAGLFVVEHRASLSPSGHTGAQVGLVLFIYGLVWLWLRGNALRLLWSDQPTGDGKRAIEAHGVAIRSPRRRFTPRPAYVIDISVRHRHRCVHPQGKRRGIRKCSLNFARRSS
jgi:hypothetical protein